MRASLAACVGFLAAATARADKYGIDEAMAESDGSWGAVVLVILVLGYLYFKEK